MKSCDLVIRSVRAPSLNFSIQETPFSLYLTIRKSFSKSTPVISPPPIVPAALENQAILHDLENKIKSIENANLVFKESYEKALSECKECHKTIGDLKVKLKLYDVKFETQETKVDVIVNNFKLGIRILEYQIERRHSPFKFGQSYFIMCRYFCEQNCANNFSTKGLGDKRNGLVSK